MKILLAADGSRYTRAAAAYLARMLPQLADPRETHVLHVRPPLPYEGRAQAALGRQAIDRFNREEADVALAVAERELRGAPGRMSFSWVVGDPLGEIAAFVAAHGIDQVVVGSRGHGALAGVLMGSVALGCVRELHVPVLVVPLPGEPVPEPRAA